MSSVSRSQVRREATMTVAFELASKGFKNGSRVHESVHQHHMRCSSFVKFGAHCNRIHDKQPIKRPIARQFLTGWPIERASAHEMNVQVGDSFAAIATVVDDEAEATIGDALLGGDG